MGKLAERLAQLFSAKKKIDPRSIIHEQFDWKAIEVNPEKIVDINKAVYQEFINWLPIRENRNPALIMFDNDKSRGFAIRSKLLAEMGYDIFSLIKFQIEFLYSVGYIANISEVSTKQTNVGIETRYHIYLKPSLKLRMGPVADQLFGNISIEYKLEDDVPNYFKFMAHTYQDQNFKAPLPMHEMMRSISNTEV